MDRTDHFHQASSAVTAILPGDATRVRDKRPSPTDVSDCACGSHPLEFESRHGPIRRSAVARASTARAGALALVIAARPVLGAATFNRGPNAKAEERDLAA